MDYDPKLLQRLLEEASPPEYELGFRAMFGGITGYLDGQPFASLSYVGLALKMTGADRVALLETAGVKPLQYEPNAPPSKSYLLLPDTILADPELLRGWMVRCAASLKRTPAKARKLPHK